MAAVNIAIKATAAVVHAAPIRRPNLVVGERDGGLALDIACVDQVMEQIKPSTGGPPKYSVCRRSSSHSIALTNINSPRIPRTMERNRRVRKLAAMPIQLSGACRGTATPRPVTK